MNPEAAAKAFQEWISRSIESPSVELRYCSPEQGFGLFAKRNIRRDEVVIKVPKELLITASLVADLPEYSVVLKNARLEPFEVLVLYFCLERLSLNPILCECQSDYSSNFVLQNFFERRKQNGSASASINSWLPIYLSILPTTFSTPLAAINTGIGDGVGGGVGNASPSGSIPGECSIAKQLPPLSRQLFYKQVDEFERMCEKLSVALGGWAHPELFNWAWHIVNTRCIFVDHPTVTRWHPLVDSAKTGDTIAVIPLVDMLNHSVDAHCIARFDSFSQSYVVTTEKRSVSEGDQLFVCYGPHDNCKLWLEYGFDLGDENIFNKVVVTADIFIALAKHVELIEVGEEHAIIIREAGFPCTIYASDDEPNYGLRTNCAILLLPQDQLPNWRELVYQYGEDEDEDDLEFNNLLDAILEQLRLQLKQKANKVMDAKIGQFWMEQVGIVARMQEARVEKQNDE